MGRKYDPPIQCRTNALCQYLKVPKRDRVDIYPISVAIYSGNNNAICCDIHCMLRATMPIRVVAFQLSRPESRSLCLLFETKLLHPAIMHIPLFHPPAHSSRRVIGGRGCHNAPHGFFNTLAWPDRQYCTTPIPICYTVDICQ
jgi:hypothetical protein